MASKSNAPRMMNKKKKFVADGVFHAELHSFLTKALSSAGYSGIEVRVTPVKTEIRIRATKEREVMGVEGRKIRELTSLVQKRFNYPKDAVELTIVKTQNKGLCASTQAELCKMKLLSQVPVRMAANAVIRGVINDGARGCAVIISGKLQ
jgi:small subunit ribosomal protein S3e